VAAGATAEQIVALDKADIAERERALKIKREKDAARQRRHRESRDVTVTECDKRDPSPKEYIQTPTHEKPKPNGLVKKQRGTRLLDDWQLPDEWREWAKKRVGWTDADCDEEAEIFLNHWTAKTGQAATSINWFRTWQNWVIRSFRKPGSAKPKAGQKRELTAQEWRERAEWYVRHGKPDYAEECRRKAITLETKVAA
jgi:hypothetical protein